MWKSFGYEIGSVPHLSKSMLERIEQLPSVVNMPLTLL